MRSLFLTVFACALVLPPALEAQGDSAQAPAIIPSVELPPQLDRVLRDYERAWQARDASALAELFTEDGFVLQNGRHPVRGRVAIRAAYARAGGPLVLRALNYAIQDSVGFIIGAYATKAGEADVGKFVLPIRRRGGGRWLIAADIDNGNAPPRRMGPS